jgi:hypothetical protein
MSESDSNEKSHTVATTVVAVATDLGMTADHKLFLSMDLTSADSVKKFIPYEENKGDNSRVPLHIRACSDNPREILLAIRGFRRMGGSMQLAAGKDWSSMHRNLQSGYKKNLNALIALKAKLMANDVNWNDVAPNIDGLDQLKKTQKADRERVRLALEKKEDGRKRKASTTGGGVLQQASKRPHVTPPAAAVAARALENAWENNNNENLDPQHPAPRVRVRSAPNVDEEQQAAGKKHVGLASNDADRMEKAAELQQTSRHDKKRRVGVHATSLNQQGDATANRAMQTAVEAVGKALDTIYCPGRVKGQPRRACMLVDVSEVEENAAHGGTLKSGQIRRVKTAVTIVGPEDVLEMAWILDHMTISLKYKNDTPGHMYDRVMIPRNSETGLVTTSVETWKAGNKASREQPAKKPRTHGVVLAEQHQRSR